MAPIPEDTVDTDLKRTIQLLYDLQSTTHGYQSPSNTTPVLISQIKSLAASLATLSQDADSSDQTTAKLVPPEIIAYIEEGRNPDIYTREFVELVMRGNVFLKGKSEAFEGFADVLGREMDGAGVGSGRGEEIGEGLRVKKKEEEEGEGEGEKNGGGMGSGDKVGNADEGMMKDEAMMMESA